MLNASYFYFMCRSLPLSCYIRRLAQSLPVFKDATGSKLKSLSFINAMIPRSSDEEQRLFARVESEITDNQIAGTK